MVLLHARALLVGTPEGATAYLDADVREPEKILASATRTLDFTQPIALMMLGIMGNVLDFDEAYAIVQQLIDAMPSGSYLALSDGTVANKDLRTFTGNTEGFVYRIRSPEEITRFFDGLELLEPGVVSVSQWRPTPPGCQLPDAVEQFGGVARKP